MSQKSVSSTSKRQAFLEKFSEKSKLLHDIDHLEMHGTNGDLLRPLVFGGIDGLLTCLSVITASLGANLSSIVVIILASSNIIADAISMASSDYLSNKAERDYIYLELEREKWEYRNYKEGEINEMIVIFTARGMSKTDATMVVNTMAKYENFFVHLMLTEELGYKIPSPTNLLLKEAFVMFISFILFGFIPLLSFMYGLIKINISPIIFFRISILLAAIELFILGTLKSNYSLSTWYYSGFETLFLGGICALIAFIIGYYVNILIT